MKHGRVGKHISTAERFAALSRVGIALMRELDENRLLHLIAETACELTGAGFAAFTLRSADESDEPLVPAQSNLFHLTEVVGATEQQKALLQYMSLDEEGPFAPIFRDGTSVLIADTLQSRLMQKDALIRPIDVHEKCPLVRSFLGAPLLDHEQQVRGGLLLGHSEPGRFTKEDETLLVGLAAQAAVALENTRLYRAAQMRAHEMNAIFESIADGIILVDQHGSILRENRTACRLHQQLEANLEQQSVLEELLYAPAQRALQGGKIEQDISLTLVDEDKEVRTYLVNASPLRLPNRTTGPLQQEKSDKVDLQETISGAVVVWHDVTEARHLLFEQRLHAETERRRALLQKVLDELPGSVYLVRGYDARLVLANRATTEVWGSYWAPGQPMVAFFKEHGIRIMGTDGHALVPEEFATMRALQGGEAIRQQQEEIIRHPDGTTLPVLVNAIAIDVRELYLSESDRTNPLTETSEPAAIVVYQDVTALKETERLKDEFLGMVAHELRNPLAALKGFAQMLLLQTARGKGTPLDEWQIRARQGIDQAASRMTQLTEDLLDVARLQAGRLELHMEPADLVALVRQVIMLHQAMTEQHTFSLHAPLERLIVSIDSARMEQVLSNLISNAIKYSPEGGAIEIALREDVEEQTVLLSVRDHGIGIPLHQQSRLFGRFMRADNARSHGITGTGLGLYLCRELVEQQHGRIWFESTDGGGSTFFIALAR